jgi:hypothetical protein
MLSASPLRGSYIAVPLVSQSDIYFSGKKRKNKKKKAAQFPGQKPALRSKASDHSGEHPSHQAWQPFYSTSVWGRLKRALWFYLMAFAGIQQAVGQISPEDPRFFYNTPNATPGKNSHWGPNIEVFASASQRHFSIFDRYTATGFYTQALAKVLGRDEVNSIGEAHGILQEKGYPTSTDEKVQKPVSTHDVQAERNCLEIWRKDAPPNTARFALLLVNGPEVRANLRLMQKTLKNLYTLPDSRILSVKDGTNKDFRSGLRKLMREMVLAKRTGQEVEALVYYSGHGTTTERNASRLLSYPEGEANGQVQTADGLMTEKTFREMVERYLPDMKTAIILDSCHSGSWIG